MDALTKLIFLINFYIISACPENETDLGCALWSVKKCYGTHLEKCLVGEVAAIVENYLGIKGNREGRVLENRLDFIQEKLLWKTAELLGFSSVEDATERADNVLRTYRRAWKVLIPLLIGVKLKLATFVPMVIVVLTLIAKGAFISSNLALFFSGLNIALKYFYPKWDGHEAHNIQNSHLDQSYQAYYSKVNDPYHQQYTSNYNGEVS